MNEDELNGELGLLVKELKALEDRRRQVTGAGREDNKLLADIGAGLKSLEAKAAELASLRAKQRTGLDRAQLQMAMDNSTDGMSVCTYDPKTKKRRLVMCNRRYVEMSGRSLQELSDAEDLNELTEIVDRGADDLSSMQQGTSRWLRSDGKENYFEWTAWPVTVDGRKCFMGVDRDVTARRQAKRELEEQHSQIKAILDNSSDGISFSEYPGGGDAWRLVMCNDRYVEMTGRTREELFAADDMRKFTKLISLCDDYWELKRKNLPRQGMATWLRPDGKENYSEWRVRSVQFGREKHFIGVSRDVTERFLAEREIKRQHEWLRAILENSSDGICVTEYPEGTSKWRLVMCNDRFVEITGRTREELLAADDLNEFAKVISRCDDYRELKKKNLPRQGMATWFRLDGKENYIEWRVRSVQLSGKKRFIGIHRDVTERVLAEREIKRQHEWLRAILENSSDGIALTVFDPDPLKDRLVMCNDRFVEMSGYTREQLIAAEGITDLMRPISRMPDYHERKKKNLPRGGMSSWIRPDGKENFFEWRVRSVHLDGKSHLIGSYRDVTDRVKAERALEKISQAERIFRKKLEALNEVNMQLSAAESVDHLCRLAIELGLSRLGFDRLGLWLASPDEPDLIVGTYGTDEKGNIRDERGQAHAGDRGGYLGRFVEGSLSVAVLRNGELVDDARRVVGLGDRVVAPLWDGQKVIGFIQTDNLIKKEPITDHQIELLTLYASAVGHLYTRKLAEQALRINEFAIASSVVAIAMSDMEGKLVYVNPAFLRMWGHEAEAEVLGRPAVDFWEEPDAPLNVMQRLKEEGQCVGEMLARRRDGTLFDAHVTGNLVIGGDGKPIRMMASFVDMTERKRLENEVLQAGIAARQRAGQDLHDSLGQTLTGVAFLSRGLQENLAKKGAPEAEEARKIATYVDESIGLTRALSRGLQPIKFASGGLLQALTELTHETSDMFHVKCDVLAPESIPSCDEVIATHVYHIAQEAVSNAVRHGKAKNVTVELRLLDKERMELIVTDDGKGMPSESEGEGMGMRTMRYRADAVRGTFRIGASAKGGTTVSCVFRARPSEGQAG